MAARRSYMKKIAIVSYGGLPLPPVKGGAVENLIQFFVENNEQSKLAELTVFSSYDSAAECEAHKYKNAKFVYIHAHKARDKITRFTNLAFMKLRFGARFQVFPYLIEIVKIIKKSDFDCVIVENRADYVPYLNRKLDIPVILHMHNDYLRSGYYLARSVVDSCDKIIAVSDYVKKCILTIKDTDKVAVLRNVIDVKSFAGVSADVRNRVREAHGIGRDDVVFAFVGRLTRSKGVAELVEAFSRVAEKHSNAKLLIVGAKWFSAGNESEFTKQLQASSERVKDKIIFTGYVEYSRIAEQYACADVVVVPSVAGEACGLVVLEAMASGKALIVSDSGGIPEHIAPGGAIVIPRGEGFVGGLSAAMEKLIMDSALVKSMGENGAARADMYDRNEYLKHLLDLIGD